MATNFLKPEFFIIGERKCGTSSLYRYLLDHPCLIPCKVKEPQFFSHSRVYRLFNLKKYLSLFPVVGGTEPIDLEWFFLDDNGVLSKERVKYRRNESVEEMTGEASANTFAQVPPRRLKKYFPNAKPIVVLRNPTERAYSHYRMFERFKQEGRRLPFELSNFEQDARREIDDSTNGKRTYFIGPGIYYRRLKLWLDEFGETGLHIVFTKSLENSDLASKEMDSLCRFLGIESHDFDQVLKSRFNTSPAQEMSTSIKTELDHFYENYNDVLEDILHVKLPWR